MRTSYSIHWRYSLIVAILLCVVQTVQCQLTLAWYRETPATESHSFRAIAIDNEGRYFYVSDLLTDVVYVYAMRNPDIPLKIISDPSWSTATFGPYGIDMSADGLLYIALWKDEDANGDGLPDHSLWRYNPLTKKLTQLCLLPDAPRGIKVAGAGMQTVIYVCGNFGNVIRCRPNARDKFTATILFPTGVYLNQQCVIADRCERSIYVSSWTIGTGTTPYKSPVTRWTLDGKMDPAFSVEYLTEGNVPGMELGASGKDLYLFHISIPPTTGARIYAVNPLSGAEKGEVLVGPSGSLAGGNICLSRSGDILFARTLETRIDQYGNPNNISAYGVVSARGCRSPREETLADPPVTGGTLESRNYPNPFNPSTTISFTLPARSGVTLTLFNSAGLQLAILVNGELDAGVHEVRFDATKCASGAYFYRIQTETSLLIRKMLLVR